MKECSQGRITLYQENQQLRAENEKQNEIIEQQKATIKQMVIREIIVNITLYGIIP